MPVSLLWNNGFRTRNLYFVIHVIVSDLIDMGINIRPHRRRLAPRQWLKGSNVTEHDLQYGEILGSYTIPSKVSDGICVDIGANGGEFTSIASTKFTLVHAYEPIPSLANSIVNRNLSNVKVFNEGVGSHCSSTQLVMHRSKDSGSSILRSSLVDIVKVDNHWVDTDICDVTVVDFETVVQRVGGHIDYLKMDCEVSEYAILMNKDLGHIRYIGIELHGQMGEDNWKRLSDWVGRTHIGFPSYTGNNAEVLLTNRQELSYADILLHKAFSAAKRIYRVIRKQVR